jgi:hypothetical protein
MKVKACDICGSVIKDTLGAKITIRPVNTDLPAVSGDVCRRCTTAHELPSLEELYQRFSRIFS